IVDTTALAVNGTASGNLTLNAANDLTDSGSVQVTGSSSLKSPGGNVIFNGANDFTGPVEFYGKDVTIVDSSALAVSGTALGDLNLNAKDNLIESGSVHVDGTSILKSAAGGEIYFNEANDFVGAVDFYGGDVTLHDITALKVSGTASGKLVLTAE